MPTNRQTPEELILYRIDQLELRFKEVNGKLDKMNERLAGGLLKTLGFCAITLVNIVVAGFSAARSIH